MKQKITQNFTQEEKAHGFLFVILVVHRVYRENRDHRENNGVQGIQGIQGPTGPTGNGISSIAKTGTSGLVDTYTITFTNGNTTTFNVTNGNGITSITKTATVGSVDTYTITFTNGTTTTFDVTNGEVTQAQLDEVIEEYNRLLNNTPSASPTPSDTLYINDSADLPLKKFVLEGKTEQFSTTGKQLFNISKVKTQWYNEKGLKNNGDGTLTVSTSSGDSTVTGSSPNNLSDYCPTLQVGDEVYLKATSTGSQKIIYLVGANTTWAFGTKRTITQAMLDSKVYWYASGINTTETISDIMCSTELTDYEPYTGGIPSPSPTYPQEIKNVEGTIQIKKVNKNITKEQFDQKLKIVASGNDRILEVSTYNIAQIVPCKPSTTYVIDGDFTKFVDGNCRVRAFDNYPALGIIDRSTAFANGTSRFTITTDATSHYLFIYDTSDTRNLNVPNMFVCEQQYADTYEEHAEKTYNFPLSEGQKLMQGGRIDGKVKNEWKNVVLDGTENYTVGNTVNNNVGIRLDISEMPTNLDDAIIVISNYFLGQKPSDVIGNGYTGISSLRTSGSHGIYFRVPTSICTNETQFKTFVANLYANGTPVIIEYELATPDETDFTTEQQAVYDEIISDGTYTPVTHYSTNAVLNPDINMSYYRDLPTIINNLEN